LDERSILVVIAVGGLYRSRSERPYDLNDSLNSPDVLQGANSHPAG